MTETVAPAPTRIVFGTDGWRARIAEDFTFENVRRCADGVARCVVERGDQAKGVVVAYEADAIDPETHLGWSVVVTGYARPVTDPEELARYQAMLRPWVSGTMDHAVRIRPDLITGIRLTAVEADA